MVKIHLNGFLIVRPRAPLKMRKELFRNYGSFVVRDPLKDLFDETYERLGSVHVMVFCLRFENLILKEIIGCGENFREKIFDLETLPES